MENQSASPGLAEIRKYRGPDGEMQSEQLQEQVGGQTIEVENVGKEFCPTMD